MNRPRTVLAIWAAAVLALLWAAADGPAAEEGSRTWLGTWRKNNPQWRALHLIGPQPQQLDVTKELITTLMVPNRMNVLVLHINDLTTFADGKRIEPNSSHQIDPVTPIPEIALQLPLEMKPTAVKVVPATTRLEWEYQTGMLRLVLRDFQQHAAVVLNTAAPEKLQLLSLDTPFPPPRTYETSPVIVSENFDDTPVGKFPVKPVWAANTDAKTAIRVAADPVSPTNRVLEFVDAPDARAGFLPYLVIKPNRLDRGQAKFACDCYLEPEAQVNVELRDESSGSLVVGPSVRITEAGQVQAGGKDLTQVPLRQWFHVELDFALGSETPTYSLTIVPTGRPSERFENLPCLNREFAQCTWLGVVSYATVKTHFYIDNLRLERLP